MQEGKLIHNYVQEPKFLKDSAVREAIKEKLSGDQELKEQIQNELNKSTGLTGLRTAAAEDPEISNFFAQTGLVLPSSQTS